MASSEEIPLRKVPFYKYEFVKARCTPDETEINTIKVLCRQNNVKGKWICNNIRDLPFPFIEKVYFIFKYKYFWISESDAASEEAKDPNGDFTSDIKRIYCSDFIFKIYTRVTKKQMLDFYVPLIGQKKIDEIIRDTERINVPEYWNGCIDKHEQVGELFERPPGAMFHRTYTSYRNGQVQYSFI